MKTIWKYPLTMDRDWNDVYLPFKAKVLHFGFQDKKPMLWALVDPYEANKVVRHFIIVGTGHPIMDTELQRPFKYKHINTCVEGLFVWHLFEAKENL